MTSNDRAQLLLLPVTLSSTHRLNVTVGGLGLGLHTLLWIYTGQQPAHVYSSLLIHTDEYSLVYSI